MTWTALVSMSAIVVLAGFVQGSTGVGFALVVAPVLGLVAPDMLPVAVLVLHAAAEHLRGMARTCRVGLSQRRVGHCGAASPRTFGGLWVLVALSAKHLNVLIGVSTIAAAAVTLAMPAFRPSRQPFLCGGWPCHRRDRNRHRGSADRRSHLSTSTTRSRSCARQ